MDKLPKGKNVRKISEVVYPMHGRQFRMHDGIENENPVVKMRQCKIDGTFGLSDYDVLDKGRLHEIEGFKKVLRAELLNEKR